MPNLEQATRARLAEIAEMAESGVTQMTGKSRRAHGREGEFVGRYGGLKPAYPELEKIPDGPKSIAAAIRRGKGKVFHRVYTTVEREMYRQGFKVARKSSGRPTVAPHEAIRVCPACRHAHSSSEHRFHGEGSFHRTHLFSFNPMTVEEAKRTVHALATIASRRALNAAERQRLARASQVIRYNKRARTNGPGRKVKSNLRRRATDYAANRASDIVSVGRALEVRYERTKGRAPGFYKHVVETGAQVFTVPAGWVYLPEKSVVIAAKVSR